MTQDFYVIDEDVDEAEENLIQQIARKMEDGLNDKQDSNEFEDQFDKDENKQLTRMKCRSYIDLQSNVCECNVLDTYKQIKCHSYIQQTKQVVPLCFNLKKR